ncbi:MAG: O-methyltransferase [Bacteroidota bacterium]
MHFLSAVLESYIAEHSENEPELLAKLTRETHLKVVRPRMITGHFQGRVLSMLSKLIRPKRILEIGTYTGYSALCLAEGMHPDGELHTIEVNEELYDLQQRYFQESAYSSQIIQHIGNALEIIPNLEGPFDLVFIDAHKIEYDAYFEQVMDKVQPGSIILSDNVLWSGKVVEEVESTDYATQALMTYNRKLKEDPRVETVLLPIRDGLTLCRVL